MSEEWDPSAVGPPQASSFLGTSSYLSELGVEEQRSLYAAQIIK